MQGVIENKILVICDADEKYADRLLEYFLKQAELPFDLWSFSTIPDLIDFMKENSIFLLLVQEEILNELGGKICAENIFVLSSDIGKCNSASDEIRYIYRYRSAKDIMMFIYQNCTVNIRLPVRNICDNETKLIGFFTPVSTDLQTSLALTMGQILARKKPVLYLNFDGCNSFYRQDFHSIFNLSDLIFYFNHSRDNFLAKLSTMKLTMNKVDYIAPAKTYMDIQSVSGENFCEMLKYICESGLYDYVLLDMTSAIQGIFEILGMCYRIYTLEDNNVTSLRKLRWYENMIRFVHADFVQERTRYIAIPVEIAGETGRKLPEYPEELTYSCFGEYVAGILKEDM